MAGTPALPNTVKENFELTSFPGPNELAAAAAANWLEKIRPPQQTGGKFSIALSGGRIAVQLFVAMRDLAGQQGLELKSLHFFWADERCVPPDDRESNFAVAREKFFDPLNISPTQIHRIRGEQPPAEAALQAETEIRGVLQTVPASLPILDLIFLGMGEDGHVASLFPGELAEAIHDPAVYRSVVASKPPPHRVTLGYQTIAAAREVWVLASGPGKREALEESLRPTGKTPLAEVLRRRSLTKILTDIS
jgi:6-phosphogluconolactonase